MTRRKTKARVLKLSQREWDSVASILEMTADDDACTFRDWRETNGRRVPAAVRERMRKQEARRR